MTSSSVFRFRRSAIVLLALSALVLSACGEDRVQSAPSGPAAGPVAADAQAAAAAAVEKGYQGTSTLPDPTPRPRAEGKRVIFISSGQNSISTAIPLAGQMDAAQALGWETQLLDGQRNQPLWPGLVRQAIAARPDAISLQAIDCPLVSQPLEEARAAGIKIAAGYSFDCDDPKFAGTAHFDAGPFFASAK